MTCVVAIKGPDLLLTYPYVPLTLSSLLFSLATLSRTVAAECQVGHAELKRAILLGLLAREHVYVEGPPGVGKTMLAEVAAEATSLGFYFYQVCALACVAL
jgi:MoxR-like ATPase